MLSIHDGRIAFSISTEMLTVMIFVTLHVFITTNMYSINAFSSKRIPSLLNQREQSRTNKIQSRIASSHIFADAYNRNDNSDNTQGKDNNGDGSSNANPLILDWNLSSLLSCDPAMEARLFPLADVYDAATCAAENMIKTEMSSIDDVHIREGDENLAYLSPSMMPSTNAYESSFAPSSLDYDGPLPPTVLPYRMFVREYNRDMGHDGRFSVFDSHSACDETPVDKGRGETYCKGAPSLQPDVVFCMDNPLEFIRDNLSYCETKSNDSSTTVYRSNKYTKGEETVIFIPGLHTAHDMTIGEHNSDNQCKNEYQRPSLERLKYYSQVLDGLPMAQIHKGTHIDGDDLDIELTSDTINSLISFGLLTENCIQSLSRATNSLTTKRLYRLLARDLDIIDTVLSRVESASHSLADRNLPSDTKGLKHSLIRLIDIAVESVRKENGSSSSSSSATTSPHLVLMTYSATSNVLMAALSEWKNSVTTPIEPLHLDKQSKAYRDGAYADKNIDDNNFEKEFSEEEAELLLHKALTVVTISALSQGFVDGPAYIHASMNDDPLVTSLGVSNLNSEGGGKDAVYLHAVSPYLTDENDNDNDNANREPTRSCIYKNDAHNIDSCVIQYLSLVRRINGVTSFREMYNLGIAEADSKKLDINPSLFAVNSLYSVHNGNVGQLDIPPMIDFELIPAMIRATGGERYLWNPTFQLGEGGVEGYFSPLPSLEYAQGELENQLGYNVYDEIFDSCCH